MTPQKTGNFQKRLFFILIVLILVLSSLNLAKAKGWLIPSQKKIEIVDGTIKLRSMTLEQKIAQMVVVQGNAENMQAWKNLMPGGLHMFGRKSEHVFRNTILDFQYNQSLPFFVTLDLEGCVNPFSYYRNFTPASAIENVGQAFSKGFEEGKYLREVGFSINFAPVVDLRDDIWQCRSFPGDEQHVSELAESYLLGLQAQGILGTVKHYPGKTLIIKDPHKFIVAADIEAKDLYPYQYLLQKKDAKAIMVSHIIASGAVDSAGVPAVVSEKVIGDLKKNFDGLIISDEINMLGLKDYYPNIDDMYIAVFKAGNDIVLNFNKDPNEIYRMILVVKKAVEDDIIPEEQIDASVTKILKAKGFKVN